MRGLPEYCIYTSISSHVRGCSHDFLLKDPSGLEKSKGRTTHGGRPGSASSTSRTTRETSSSRSSLSAPACARPTSLPPFFPHRSQTHRRESRRCSPRPVHVLSKVYLPRFTNTLLAFRTFSGNLRHIGQRIPNISNTVSPCSENIRERPTTWLQHWAYPWQPVLTKLVL